MCSRAIYEKCFSDFFLNVVSYLRKRDKDNFIGLLSIGQTTRKPLNQIQAADVRDSIVKALYSGVFKAIIDQINKSIEGSMSLTRARYLSIKILFF